MADFQVTVTVTFPVRAKSEEEASERADLVLEALTAGTWPKFKKTWFPGDLEFETEIEEEA